MITNSNGSSPIKIIWPDIYEMSKASNLSYTDFTLGEQLISEWAWVKMRLQKATSADSKKKCDYDECDDPITIENKRRYDEFNRNSNCQVKWERLITFHVGEHVVREQWSGQTFNTLHIMCAIRKLHRIQLEMEEGIHALTESTQKLINEGISYNDE